MNSDPTLNPLGSQHTGKRSLHESPWRGQVPTCAAMPILCQLVALATVALIGAIDVGALLAAALVLTLIHICGDTVSITVGPPRPHTGLGWLTRILAWTGRYFFQAPFEEGGTRQAIQQGQVLWPQDKAKAEPGAILLEQMTPVT